TVHFDYLRHTQEQAVILKEVVKQGKSQNPLNNSLDHALVVTPKNKDKRVRFTEPVTSLGNTKTVSSSNLVFNKPMLSSTGVKPSTSTSGSQPSGNTKKDKIQITTTTEVPSRNTIALEIETTKPVVTLVYLRKPRKSKTTDPVSKSKVIKSISVNKKEPSKSWGSIVSNVPSSSHDECRLSKLFFGTVKFKNDHVAKIMGYDDYQIGVDLLTGSRGNNLYTLSLVKMMASSLIYLLLKASKTKSWLWHRRLSHLNFGAISHFARHGLVRGLPKLKYEKDHLCSACAMGKSKKKPHKPKYKDTNQEKLYLLHMDLCGPMRVTSVNGKKYILVIVDDYSRFTWIKCLSPKVIAPIAEVVAPEPIVSTGSPSSTTVNQDAPSPSNSQPTPKTQSPLISNDIVEENHNLDVAHMNNDPFFSIPILENDSEASSSLDVIPTVSKYALESLKKYAMESSDPVDTPMVEKSKLDEDPQGKATDLTHYHGMVGTLMYLTANRPDLTFVVCMCAWYQSKPTEKSLHAIKRIFKYLRGTVNRGLWYPKDSSIALTSYADADHTSFQATR
nr:uncharacterized mitochondrial protein AtMg00810-like [Tanacetum cinerariifolium]